MTLKEINDEISRLRNIARELENKEREENKELARKFVGKCYKSDSGSIVKIIGIPRTLLMLSGERYEENRFPAVFLHDPKFPCERYHPDNIFHMEILDHAVFLHDPKFPCERYYQDDIDKFAPCCCGTAYFNVKDDKPMFFDEEITQEEFNVELDKCIIKFKEMLNT